MFQTATKTMCESLQNYFAFINRRYFCGSVTGLLANLVLAKLPFGPKQRSMTAVSSEFLVVNGWVLTPDDVAASKLTRNVVRL